MSRRVLFLLAAIASAGCSPKTFILKKGAESAAPYFDDGLAEATSFEKLTAHVYTFRWKWYRNVAVDTDEGWVVVDPFNPEAAKAEMAYLQKTEPAKKVRLLVYSHYHLDHTRGGAAFAAQEILAHEKVPGYFAQLKISGMKQVDDALPPTRLVSGDQDFTVGGVRIRMIDLGRSHTDCLYAFLFPDERLLFTADTGLVKTVPPLGVPDSYWPGEIAAYEKLIALDFDVFVPSHFGYGKKQDLVDDLEYFRYTRQVTREALALYGTPEGKKQVDQYFDYVYPKIAQRYGDWHGFQAMAIPNMFRDVSGELLGY